MRRNAPAVGENVTNCPTCGYPVRIMYRDGLADHYEPVMDGTILAKELSPVDAETATKLRELRKGKKTVALVGMAPTNCALAPYNEKGVEVWGLNEAALLPWLKSWDRWFQMHPEKDFTRDLDVHRAHERGVIQGHYAWLQKNHGKPIYMLYSYPDVPNCSPYPLQEVVDRFFGNIRNGDEKIKYLTSSFAYMVALALFEDFDRIEVYGFEMSGGDEYIPQKACAEFWLGVATGMGKEIYVPPKSLLLWGPLYGYQGSGARNEA